MDSIFELLAMRNNISRHTGTRGLSSNNDVTAVSFSEMQEESNIITRVRP